MTTEMLFRENTQSISLLPFPHPPLLYWDIRPYTPPSFVLISVQGSIVYEANISQIHVSLFNTKFTKTKDVKPVQKHVAVGFLKLVVTVSVDGTVSSREGCLSLEIALCIFSTTS